jgi:hypothetical protein
LCPLFDDLTASLRERLLHDIEGACSAAPCESGLSRRLGYFERRRRYSSIRVIACSDGSGSATSLASTISIQFATISLATASGSLDSPVSGSASAL